MELMNENDLQNVCGGAQGDAKAAATAAGVLLLVCGAAILTVCDGDFRIETIIRRPRPVVTTTQTTYTTHHYYY